MRNVRVWYPKLNKMMGCILVDYELKSVKANYPQKYYDEIYNLALDKVVLMDSTNVINNDGIEIFEGDIIYCPNLEIEMTVTYDEIYHAFVGIYKGNKYMRWGSSVKLLGNIYEGVTQ